MAAASSCCPGPTGSGTVATRSRAKPQQLSLSEPDRHNAIHGLVRHVPWQLVAHTADRVEQRVRVYPQSGWPGTIEAVIVHTVGDDGVVTELTVTNIGSGPVPFGYAAHPYLTVGEDTVDDVVISVPAERYLAVDDRLLPLDLILVEGRDEDLRTPAVLGDTPVRHGAGRADPRRGRSLAGPAGARGPLGRALGRRGPGLDPGVHRERPSRPLDRRGADDLRAQRLQPGADARRHDHPRLRVDRCPSCGASTGPEGGETPRANIVGDGDGIFGRRPWK